MAAFNLISCAGCGAVIMTDGRQRFNIPSPAAAFFGWPRGPHQCPRISEEDVKEIPELVERMFRA